VVALFGPTNPDGTGPYGQRQNVIQMRGLPCVPCMKGHCSYLDPLACLKNISAAMVLEAARKALESDIGRAFDLVMTDPSCWQEQDGAA